MKRFRVAADILIQSIYEVEADTAHSARLMIETEEIKDATSTVQVTSPVVTHVEEIK